jgi:hypothetical protein
MVLRTVADKFFGILFLNVDEGRLLGHLFSEHNLTVRMVPHRSEEYEFVAYTMPAGSATKLQAVNLVLCLHLRSPTLCWVSILNLNTYQHMCEIS